MEFRFEVEPVPQSRPRVTRTGRVYTTKKCADYRATVRRLAVDMMQDNAPLAAPLAVGIAFFTKVPSSWSKVKHKKACDGEIWPTSRTGDIDNLVKAVLDSCNGVVWLDDCQIMCLSASKLYADKPAVVLTVRELR